MEGMKANMKFDMIFGEHAEGHKIFKTIRMKALRMYVEPYKTIDLKEVAKAFGQPLETIESDIADLITDSDNPLKAKIDSFKKILYSKKQNTQIKMYQNAQALGKQYIIDTENMLLKVAVI
jgi:26S proteasome regulatory subunit N7